MLANNYYESLAFNFIYWKICKELLKNKEKTAIKNEKGFDIFELVNATLILKESKCCFSTIIDINFDFLKKAVENNLLNVLGHKKEDYKSTQFFYALNTLKEKIHRVNAIIVLYYDNYAVRLQFLYRDNLLHLFIQTLTKDIYNHLPYDVPFFVLLLHKMAKELNVLPGELVFNATSLYLYKSDADKVDALLRKNSTDVVKPQFDLFNENIRSYI